MKFKVDDKVTTPMNGEGKIMRICTGGYEVRIDEPNPYTTRWGQVHILYYRESELRKVSND